MSKATDPDSALDLAAQAVGNQAKLAALLGFKGRAGVQPWFSGTRIVPEEYCPRIEELAHAIDKRVTCEALRPDLVWFRVPDTKWRGHKKGRPLIDIARCSPRKGTAPAPRATVRRTPALEVATP